MKQKIVSLKENVCTVLNYIEHLFIVVSMFTGYASITACAFVPLVGIPIGTANSVLGPSNWCNNWRN